MPFNALEVYGKASRIPVNAMIDGLTFRTTLLPGTGVHYMVINDAMREATGKGLGDTITVELDVDDKPREVTVPVDIQQALHKDRKAMERTWPWRTRTGNGTSNGWKAQRSPRPGHGGSKD